MIKFKTIGDILEFYGKDPNKKPITLFWGRVAIKNLNKWNVIAHSKIPNKIIDNNLQDSQTILIIAEDTNKKEVLYISSSRRGLFEDVILSRIDNNNYTIPYSNFTIINRYKFKKFIKQEALKKL